MSKPTDGRSWLPKYLKDSLTKYRDTAQEVVRRRALFASDRIQAEADAAFLKQSQDLCTVLHRLYRENRSMTMKLQQLGQPKHRGHRGRFVD